MGESDDLGVPHQDGNNFVKVGYPLKHIILEDSGELVFDGGQQGHQVQRIDLQVATQVGVKSQLAQVDDLQVTHYTHDSRFDLSWIGGTSFLSRVGRSSGWA